MAESEGPFTKQKPGRKKHDKNLTKCPVTAPCPIKELKEKSKAEQIEQYRHVPFGRTEAEYDPSHLTKEQRACLVELGEAADAVSRIYWKQLSEHGLEIYQFCQDGLRALDPNCPSYEPLKEYTERLGMYQWYYDPFNGDTKFTPNVSAGQLKKDLQEIGAKDLLQKLKALKVEIFHNRGEKRPLGANFYGPWMTKELLNEMMKDNMHVMEVTPPDVSGVQSLVINPISARKKMHAVDTCVNYYVRPQARISQEKAEAKAKEIHDLVMKRNEMLKEAAVGPEPEKDMRKIKQEYGRQIKSLARDLAKELDLIIIPYHVAYEKEIREITGHMEEAAKLADKFDPRFAQYLRHRALALKEGGRGKYDKTDIEWVGLCRTLPALNLTIGPIETYDDKIFSAKGSFHLILFFKDEAATETAKKLGKQSPAVEKALPCEARYKRPEPQIPSTVFASTVLVAGMGSGPFTPIAFMLPNPDWIAKAHGRVMHQTDNLLMAKIKAGPRGIVAKHVLAPELLEEFPEDLRARGLCLFITGHEYGHGHGRTVKRKGSKWAEVDGRTLGAHYSVIEEAKANIVGLHSLSLMKGIPKKLKQAALVSYAADTIICINSDPTLEEAHNEADVIGFNLLVEKGAVIYHPETAKYSFNFKKAESALKEAAEILLTVRGEGSQSKAEALRNKYGRVMPTEKHVVSLLPVDIPKFVRLKYPALEKTLAGRYPIPEGWLQQKPMRPDGVRTGFIG